MEKIFEQVFSTPFIVVPVMEKIGMEIRRKILHLNLEALPSDPDELGVIEDVVSGCGPKGFETSRVVELGSSETLLVGVTESNQGGRRVNVRWQLELGEYNGDCGGSRKISGIL